MRGSPGTTSSRAFATAVAGALVVSALFGVLLLSDLSQATKEAISSLGFVIGGLSIVVNGLLAARRGRDRRRRAWLILALRPAPPWRAAR